MGKKAKNFRAWLYQNPNGTIEDAWNAAWEGQNALQYSQTIQGKDAEIERLKSLWYADVDPIETEYAEDYRSRAALAGKEDKG